MSAPPLQPPRESFDVSTSNERHTADKRGSVRETFSRAWTENTGFARAFTRVMTEGAFLNAITEDAWTRKLMDEVVVHSKKGVEGDIPAPAGFTGNSEFWKVAGLSAFFGVLLGFIGLSFLVCAEKLPKLWVHNSSFSTYDDVDFYAGKQQYIIITGLTGLLVGILRVLFKYPETIDGIFKEIEHYHVNPQYAPSTILLSAISLGGGACLGPEQALGNIGGGFATYLVENIIEFPNVADRQLVVLCAMTAAFGALFPTPVLGVLLIYELGQPPKPFMETIVSLSIGAITSFLIYYQFCEKFTLDRLTTNGVVLSLEWEFNIEQCWYAVGFGIVSGGICLVNVIGLGIMKQIFNRIRDRLENTKLNGTIVTAVIGGVVVGTISWVLPLTIGDGNMAFAPIIKLTFQQVQSYTMDDVPGGMMTAHLLICSMFAKMFSLGVSMNCGFVGGFVFPMLTIGCMAGGAAALTYIDQPPGFCIACFMTAVPAGICPMPFTLLGIGVYCFFFGLYQTVPIYIAIMTSYVVVCGSGIFRKLADRGDAAAALRAQQKGEVDKNEEDTIVNNPINDSLNSSISADSIYSKPKRPVAPRNDGLVSDV